MIYNEQTAELEEKIHLLGDAILNSLPAKEYVAAFCQKEQDPKTCEQVKEFNRQKQKFAAVAEYGDYAPGFQAQRQSILQAKRELDLLPTITKFRASETALQALLDEVGQKIAATVSPKIKVDAGNPFFLESNKACGGNCHGKKSSVDRLF